MSLKQTIKKQTAEQLYLQIKQDIQNKRLPIEQPLKQTLLSQKYGVSRIPIRDVLRRLHAEGWLCSVGKRGLMVPALTATEAEDLYLMRMHLEPMLLDFALPNINHQTIGLAKDVLFQIDTTPNLSIEEHGELNSQFHLCLYALAKRPAIYKSVISLHRQCARYIGYQNQELNYIDVSQSEHYMLLDMVTNKQHKEALALLTHHIQDAGKNLVNHLSKS